MLSAVELWCQFCRHKLRAKFTQINSRGWCCFQCCVDIRPFFPPPFLGLIGQPSFHLVVFRSVEKIQHNALVWRVGKGPITRKNMDRMGQMREWADLISFFPPPPLFSKWLQRLCRCFRFFRFNFKQSLQQTDIIRACCIGFDTK